MRFFHIGLIAALAVTWVAESGIQSRSQDSSGNSKPAESGNHDADSCNRTHLLDFQVSREGEDARAIPVWQAGEKSAFFYESGMYIDADGAPNAYNPENTGLDDLANAGDSSHWYALAQDEYGEPYVQGNDAPYPGYYISTTALYDRTKNVRDPHKYVDASKIPYVVLPHRFARQMGARLGDFATVLNLRTAKNSAAIFADVGPEDFIGEGSIALAQNIGVRSSPRRGGANHGIVYLIFPGSGNGRPRSLDEINTETAKLLETWGGLTQLTACAGEESSKRSATR